MIMRKECIDDIKRIELNKDYSFSEITILDGGEYTSAIRILQGVKGVKMYKFVLHKIVDGIGYINAFFENNENFKEAVSFLEKTNKIKILKNNEKFKDFAISEDKKYDVYPNVFDEYLKMEKNDKKILIRLLNKDTDLFMEFSKNTKFLNHIFRYGRIAWNVLSAILTLKELMELYSILGLYLPLSTRLPSKGPFRKERLCPDDIDEV